MLYSTTIRRASLVLLFTYLTGRLVGGDALDLKRMTPVPASEPIPAMDFFRPSVLQGPKLNGAGTHIAAIVTSGVDRHDLMVYELKTKKAEAANGSSSQDVFNVRWLDDHKLVFTLFQEKMYGVGLYAADAGRIANAYPLFQYYGSSILSVPPGNPLHPLVWNRYDSINDGINHDLGVCDANAELDIGGAANLLRADANHSEAIMVRDVNQAHMLRKYPVPQPGSVTRYLTDQQGQLAFAITLNNGAPELQRLEKGRWIRCPVDLDQIDVIDSGGQPNQLVVLGPRQEGKPRPLQLMDAATGGLGEILVQDTEYDFNGRLYRHPVTNEILGASFERNGPRSVWFSDQYQKFQTMLDSVFPGLVVKILGSDNAQKIFLVVTFSDRQPETYHWVDLAKKTAGLFRNSAPWIDPSRIQPEHIIKFKTRDGHPLDAYLTLPAGTTKDKLAPLVVLPHGGPWVRDTWGFNGEVQFLVSRGYAVLQPNYRGSTGYNWMFEQADQFDFLKMQNDVTDATRTAVATGLVDRDRIAIMGASFGGYLAVSGVASEPSLYRCAVTNAGVFDWAELIREKNAYYTDGSISAWFKRGLGDPKNEQEKFEAISPMRHVDQIRVPVFVAGGKDDRNVDITQSKRLIAALKKNQVPYESFLVSEEGHGMRHLVNQVELYTRIEAFLSKYMAPRPSSTPAP